VVMNAGRIEQIGSPSDLYERPATPFVADFIGKTNFFRGTMKGDAFVTEFGLSFRPDRKLADATLLGVRPEKIQISPQVNQPNSLEGVVELVSYLGPSTEYRVRIAADRHVLVQQPNREAKALFDIGQKVSVIIPPDSCLLFAADQAQASSLAEMTKSVTAARPAYAAV